MCHYGMAVWGRGLHQELCYAVDGNVINSALHGVNQVVIKFGYLYDLVDNNMVYLSIQWMSILKYCRYYIILSMVKSLLLIKIVVVQSVEAFCSVGQSLGRSVGQILGLINSINLSIVKSVSQGNAN